MVIFNIVFGLMIICNIFLAYNDRKNWRDSLGWATALCLLARLFFK